MTSTPSFTGLLGQQVVAAPASGRGLADAVVVDLHIDQIVEAVAGDNEQRELITALFHQPVQDLDTVHFRQEVFRDLEDRALLERLRQFTDGLRQVRSQLGQAAKMRYRYQRQAWLLDAVALYCQSVQSLSEHLDAANLHARGLRAFHRFLSGYVAAASFATLVADTEARRSELSRISYSVRIRGGTVEVGTYHGEPDYSAEVEAAFARFQQAAVKDYRVTHRGWPGMNHVGAQILDRVARLYPQPFAALSDFCERHAGFLDESVALFDRDLQFYLSYLEYAEPLRSAGLSLCYPEVSDRSKEVFATATFDLSLASLLVARGTPVVCNDFELTGPERIFVVSGPNQGGKTTFARTFGQLHLLAAIGCPVPGAAARLHLFDQLFTHFGRTEDLDSLSGKLEDDLRRIRQSLLTATADSVLVLNEVFASTTLDDARFLGAKVLAKVVALDCLCLQVTFVEELATFAPSVVSMTSTIVPGRPAERTFRVVRAPADGLAYALAIADKHRVTYAQLRTRITA